MDYRWLHAIESERNQSPQLASQTIQLCLRAPRGRIAPKINATAPIAATDCPSAPIMKDTEPRSGAWIAGRKQPRAIAAAPIIEIIFFVIYSSRLRK
jgi:hypothetical protein